MVQALNPKDSAVLVVEDNPDDGMLVARSLQTFGIKRVFAAETAEEALTFLQGHTCDVVLADYNLPGMNGLRLLEHIRESWPEIRVVLVTGVRDEHVAVSAMKAGAADYVCKDDLLTSNIIRTLQAALRRQEASNEERLRSALGSRAGDLAAALEEAEWLQALSHDGLAHRPEHAAPYGDESIDDLFDAYTRYLRDTFRLFPQPAGPAEDGLARMLLEHGSGPGEVVAYYRAALRSLLLEQVAPPLNPALCLARIFALLVEQYQYRQSMQVAQLGAP
jgi:CheY-like chemotaxis protein